MAMLKDDEKSPTSSHREHAAASVEEQGVIPQEFDDVETSRVLRKVDWRLLPVLSFLYLLAFLDRSNLGNAKVAGLAEDLELTGGQFNMAATVRGMIGIECGQGANDPAGLLLHLLPT